MIHRDQQVTKITCRPLNPFPTPYSLLPTPSLNQQSLFSSRQFRAAARLTTGKRIVEQQTDRLDQIAF